MTITQGLEVPTDALAQLCRKYHVRELSVFDPAARVGWEFFDLDLELLWNIVSVGLAPLRQQLAGIQQGEFPEPPREA